MADNNYPNHTEQKYIASMLLAAVGDAIGYKNGEWEFCKSGSVMHAEAESMGGVGAIKVNPKYWIVSDDTVMHIATAKALLEWNSTDKKELYTHICEQYVECWKDMSGRAPGIQCGDAMPYLKKGRWEAVPFSGRAGGCGASMRSMCIGLIYYKPEQLDDLIAVSIESGRMTHNHPTGFLGAVAAALFTSYAVQGVPVDDWGRLLVTDALPKCYEYLKTSKRDYDSYSANEAVFKYFEKQWQDYLALRGIAEPGHGPAKFPETFGVKERDQYYKSISFSGMGGSSGHDSVIIAYDALLGSGDDWIEFMKRGALHGGDSDSTGSIGAAWWGALYGLHNVPFNHYKEVEYRDIVERLGKQLFTKPKK
jgi:ADP-ribosylarginine hydrolase